MRRIRCAIYTRKSSEEGLGQEFNSLHAQREACAAYVASQRAEGWVLLPEEYDDGGLSGGTLERPALQRLLAAVDAGQVNQIVVYKIDRLTRSLADFARIVDRLDAAEASFVSVTQSFNTATSMGRLTLNMLLSFAQFEREVTAERIRDKISASKRKGMWMGGGVPIGYRAEGRSLTIDPAEAETVRTLYELYRHHGTIRAVKQEADRLRLRSAVRPTSDGGMRGGGAFDRGHLYYILTNPSYAGRIRHHRQVYPGDHAPIIEPEAWNAVQAQLQAVARKRRQGEDTATRRPRSSPLTGRLYDETGDRLTPSHTKTRQGKRLRYYVSHRLIKNSGDAAKTGWRLPAAELENAVAYLVRRHLQAPTLAARLLPEADAGEVQRIRDPLVALTEPATESRALLDLVGHVRIAPGQIDLTIEAEQFGENLGVPADRIAPEALTITAPFQQRKRGVETKLILANREGARDETLLRNIARAHQWLHQIQAGDSFEEIAVQAGTSKQRVQQLIGLAFLAPDLVQDIVQGKQPAGLTSRWLIRNRLPANWDQQRSRIRRL